MSRSPTCSRVRYCFTDYQASALTSAVRCWASDAEQLWSFCHREGHSAVAGSWFGLESRRWSLGSCSLLFRVQGFGDPWRREHPWLHLCPNSSTRLHWSELSYSGEVSWRWRRGSSRSSGVHLDVRSFSTSTGLFCMTWSELGLIRSHCVFPTHLWASTAGQSFPLPDLAT